MTDTYQQVGDVITLTASAGGVTKDGLVALNQCCVVALETAASGVAYAAAAEGVFTVTKKAGATLDFAVGEYAYALTTGGVEVAVPTGGTEAVGFAVEAAATGDTTVKVKLDRFT